MPVTCARHPTHAAWWQCPRCFKAYCPLCIVRKSADSDSTKKLHLCPTCGIETRDLVLFRVIPSLWGRLPRFLAYPFSSGTSAGFMPALALLAALFTRPGWFPAAVHFIIWCLAVTYAFAALKTTSTGSFQPPALTRKIWRDHLPQVIRQIILYLVLFLLFLFFTATFNRWIVITSSAVYFIFLPAILILLSINENLSRALNPFLIIELIRRLGRCYIHLLGLLLLIGMVMISAISVGWHLPNWCQIFVMATAFNYATVIAYHMTGYVILQNHHHLDYPVDPENILTALDPDDSTASRKLSTQNRTSANDDLVLAVKRLMQKGDLTGAIQQIEMRSKGAQINDLDLSQHYLELLRMSIHQRRFIAHAAHHLELLAKSGYNAEALTLYLECIRLDRNFIPKALVLFKIAGWLDETGKSREAVYVLKCLIKYHSQSTMVPKALYRVAQIFHEGMKDAERSRKVLTGLIQKFPDHEITAFAKDYLNSL